MQDSKQKPTHFPNGFLFGAASSSHQVEGHNKNNDWWAAENTGKVPRSGLAADHYHRFAEDFSLAHQIGLNAIRISIEWSRIEPVQGQFDPEAIAHYKQVLQAAKAQGLSRMVTLHHFTLPKWFAESGGFFRKDSAELFARYSKYVAEHLGEEVALWNTINEPEVYAVMGYRYGVWPPFQKKFWLWLKLHLRLIAAHKASYQAIKRVLPHTKVGLVKNNAYYKAVHKWNLIEWLIVKFLNYTRNDFLFLRTGNENDFLGVNYYFYHPIDWLHLKQSLNIRTEQEPKTDMGWRIFAPGLYFMLMGLKKFRKPIYITENGLADAADTKRYDFINDHLQATARAIAAGLDVRGYYYWALTDNYEWADGFGPRFGLINIDYQTQARSIRASSKIFNQIHS